MRAIWSDTRFLEAACTVEVAWVEAAAVQGIASAEAVTELRHRVAALTAQHAEVLAQLRQGARPIAPLVDVLAQDASAELLKVLHLGLTTQDVIDTALQILRGEAVSQIERSLTLALQTLDALADRHRSTEMLARTNDQTAAITTFGLFVAEGAAELARGRARLQLAHRNNHLACLSGAVGLSAPFENASDKVRHHAASALGLSYNPALTSPARDRIAELHFSICMVGNVMGRMARTIFALQSDTIGELSEETAGQSSAMPHKRNPRLAEQVIVLCDRLNTHFSGALQATQTVHHRSGQSWMKEWAATQDLFLTLDAQQVVFQRMMDKLDVDDTAMRRNIDQAGIRAVSDRVFSALSRQIGRQNAKLLTKDLLASRVQHHEVVKKIRMLNPRIDPDSVRQAICREMIVKVAASKQREIESSWETRPHAPRHNKVVR